VAAEEHGELNCDEDEEERVEEGERDRPLPDPEPAASPGPSGSERPSGGEPQTCPSEQDDGERERPSGQGVRRRERHAAGELGEGGVGRPEEDPERRHDEASEKGAARDGSESRRNGWSKRGEPAQPHERRDQRGEARPAHRHAAGEPGAREVESDDPARIPHRGKRRQGERERTEENGVGRETHEPRRGDRRQSSDEHDADAEPLTRQERGRRQGGRERRRPHRASSTTIVQPCGSPGSTRIVPPWRSTIQRAIASPSPLPPAPWERA
jgi:hypothetical protein